MILTELLPKTLNFLFILLLASLQPDVAKCTLCIISSSDNNLFLRILLDTYRSSTYGILLSVPSASDNSRP